MTEALMTVAVFMLSTLAILCTLTVVVILAVLGIAQVFEGDER